MRRTKAIAISIPSEWLPELDSRAQSLGISRNSLICILIRTGLEEDVLAVPEEVSIDAET